MSLEVNDLLFDVCVPVNNTMGEPEEGRNSREIYGFRAILISKMALTIKND